MVERGKKTKIERKNIFVFLVLYIRKERKERREILTTAPRKGIWVWQSSATGIRQPNDQTFLIEELANCAFPPLKRESKFVTSTKLFSNSQQTNVVTEGLIKLGKLCTTKRKIFLYFDFIMFLYFYLLYIYMIYTKEKKNIFVFLYCFWKQNMIRYM